MTTQRPWRRWARRILGDLAYENLKIAALLERKFSGSGSR
jgi:hypothetical protein